MDFCYCRSAEGVRSLSAPGWNEQSFLATLFSPLPILAFSPSLRQLPPTTRPPPPPRIPKEQKKEKENKKRRASNQERAGVQGGKKKRGWIGPKGRKGKGWTATKRSDCGNFPAPLVRQRESFGPAWFQHRGDWTAPRGDSWATRSHGRNSIKQPQQQKPLKTLLCIREARSVRRTAMHRQCACTTLQTLCLFL